jgi:hypothetical protein
MSLKSSTPRGWEKLIPLERAGESQREGDLGWLLVTEDFPTFRKKIRAAGENGSGSDSETLGVLMNGGMQLGKNRLHLESIPGGNGLLAQLPDSVIEPSTREAHKEKRPVSKMSGYLVDSTDRQVSLYP